MVENTPVSENLAEYYDLIYHDHDYQREVDFLDKVFHKLPKRQVSTVLNIGCNTGNYAQLLARNYFVVGVDNSAAMVALAKKKVPDVDFFVEDMRNFNMERTFDAVVCLNFALNYNLQEEDLERTLRTCARHLEKDGVLICNVKQETVQSPVTIDTADTKDINVARVSQIRQEQDLLHVNNLFLIKDKKKIDFSVDNHKLKVYSAKVIKRKLKGTGFKRVHVLHGFNFKHFGSSSAEIVIIGIKR